MVVETEFKGKVGQLQPEPLVTAVLYNGSRDRKRMASKNRTRSVNNLRRLLWPIKKTEREVSPKVKAKEPSLNRYHQHMVVAVVVVYLENCICLSIYHLPTDPKTGLVILRYRRTFLMVSFFVCLFRLYTRQ